MDADPLNSFPPPATRPVATPPPLPVGARQPSLATAAGIIVLYFLLQFMAASLIGLLFGIVGSIRLGVQAAFQNVMTQPDTRLWIVILGLVIAAGVTLWLIRRCWPAMWSQAAPPGFGWCAPRSGVEYGIAVLLGLATPVVGGMLTLWLAHGHSVPQDVKQMLDGATSGLRIGLALLVVSLGPLVEELLFRGVLLSALLRHMRAGWAIALGAVLFALVHLPDLGFLWYGLPNLALLGAMAAWLRLRSGSIWPAVLVHAINNLFAVMAWLWVAQ